MSFVPMRFKGFEWKYNPEKITFDCEKNIVEKNSPYCTQYVQNLGRKNMIISGEGYLCGSNCMEQFCNLFELFKQGGVGVLAIAKVSPIYAFFESLKIIGEPKPDILKYSFVFREDMDYIKTKNPEIHICKNGQCLWDISFLYGIEIEALVKLNAFVKFPDDVLDEGVVIRLC